MGWPLLLHHLVVNVHQGPELCLLIQVGPTLTHKLPEPQWRKGH